jgi:hypothetical protein
MDTALIEQIKGDHLVLQQGHHLAMGQSADGLQVLLVFERFNVAAGDHPAITDKDDLLDAIVGLISCTLSTTVVSSLVLPA